MPRIVIKPKRKTYSIRMIPGIIEKAREMNIDVSQFIEVALCEALELDRTEYVQMAIKDAEELVRVHSKARIDS